MPDSSSTDVFKEVEYLLEEKNLAIQSSDRTRPWGGFFVIDEKQSDEFISEFFPSLSPDDFSQFEKISPKILVVAPGKRLSWQYHHRRSEVWRVLQGEVGVVVSDNDDPGPIKKLMPGSLIRLKEGERHRLVGLNDWAILAEIWQHTDPNNPSDENDIVRVQDDFGR